ncbi:hypothetical protein Xaut_2172 [Xanthobacter versatilis]|uniref:Uncharacterized protein n=1 Tax=Xanthobacter autotrophicus (strain ATCC BAA-1158 / Py2) TaxID=78245 RepID=A7IHC3_XANP2|nr:hypothetical protein Xaut_2172 [Xanthobacter autotrophicus Py2]
MNLLEKIPNWEQLRTIGNSAPSRILAFAPFISYILILNEYALTIAKGIFSSALIGIRADIAPTFGLYCIYFGSVIFGMGSILYTAYCPQEIKKYGDVIKYLDKELKFVMNEDISRQSEYILSKVDDHINYIAPIDNTAILKNYYDALNLSRKWMRLAASALFGGGMILLFLPSLLTFLKIVRMLLR